MWLIVVGLGLLSARYFELGPFAELSWFWALLPFLLAFLWFEFIENAIGWDKRKLQKNAEAEDARRERIRQQFAEPQKSRR